MWIVQVDGTALPQKFATEEEANQGAANARGNDWDKKIVVHDENAPQQPAPPAPPAQPQPAPKTQTMVPAMPGDLSKSK